MIAKNRVEEYFREAWGPAVFDPSLYDSNNTAPEEVNLAPFTRLEVFKRLAKAENSAPGSDRLTYNHWRAAAKDATVMTAILKYRRVPPEWKKSATVLIHKKNDRSDPGNYCINKRNI